MEWAHSANSRGQRQPLVDHLNQVALLASELASAFNAGEVAAYLGLWHDVGKFSPEFQDYLVRAEANAGERRRHVGHKMAGAKVAENYGGILAFVVMGHHGGLPDQAELKRLLREARVSAAIGEAIERAKSALPSLEPAVKLAFPAHVPSDPLAAELFLRLLFSALVDADFLDTEAHFAPERSEMRGVEYKIGYLWEQFQRHHDALVAEATDSLVNRARREVYEACLAAAGRPPGLFRLTVPTGGGKTLSSMAFALRHALLHGQRRVIVAVPFITITEQTADVYRAIFGLDGSGRSLVLEHHSGIEPRMADGEGDVAPSKIWPRLAAENWDAPVIVTTTVQLFESLFAANPSKARKVHRLARSVIILDEAQSLPIHLLQPILDALSELCRHYGSTVVLSTATQPTFECLAPFASLPATEIVPGPARHFEALKRVTYEWRVEKPLSWDEVADLMRREPQALAVVNTKRDALALLQALDDPAALHLSTSLCGAHRRQVMKDVRQRLSFGRSCHLVSTQVVQAGVDLDFPLVLRAMGPLDGIIQAAGRCNREGRLREGGRVVIFLPAEGHLPAGAYRTATGQTVALLGSGELDLDDPSIARHYFASLYPLLETDRGGIQSLRRSFNFPEVARMFRMIDDDTESVVVPYGTPEERHLVERLLDELESGRGNARLALREIQPFVVNVRRRTCGDYRRRGLLEVRPKTLVRPVVMI